jgi:tripartite-type tricarboxylate transporter receptor subunit TctC
MRLTIMLQRRRFLQIASGAAALYVMPRRADAQSYPARPVRIVVGFPAGQGVDIITRLVGQRLSERLGQQFVVENRPGAGGNIATEAVVRAPAEGYTLLATGSNNCINASLYDKLSFDFIRDIAPIASVARVPNVLEVHPSVPVGTVTEFIAYAKANPGKLNVASAGNGSSSHVAAELFKMMAGVDLLHVPYRGSAQALPDLLSGRMQVMFDLLSTSVEHIRAGRLRGLAVTTAARSELLPALPTVSEFLPGYETAGLAGLGGPRDTPAEILEKLNREVNAALADPVIRARFSELSAVAVPGSRSDFAKLIADETEKWSRVVKFAGLTPV